MRQAIPGFQGLKPNQPIRFYQQVLPHWRQDGATYFVTFRLADSLPQNKLHELRLFKNDWLKKHPEPSEEMFNELAKQLFLRIEYWLDQGIGKCLLRDRNNAEIALEEICRDHGTNYELGCCVIMPNHVHAIVRPIGLELEKIIRAWKGRSAVKIHDRIGESGTLWQRESYDRIIRDEEHLQRVIDYIGRNPLRAKLAADSYLLWMNPVWQELGWGFAE